MRRFLLLILLCCLALTVKAEDGFSLLTTITGDSLGDEFGIAKNIGDVNADGYPDLAIGARIGKYVHIYFGGPEFDTTPDLTCRPDPDEPPAETLYYGATLAGQGDLNGDGYTDFVVGAPYAYHDGMAQPGRIYVYYGGPDLDSIPDLEIYGQFWYFELGSALAIDGDINNDGYDDLIAGAPNDDYDAHGRVFIYWGSDTMDTQYGALLEGQHEFDSFGWSVGYVGDLNNDDFDDFLVGAPQVLAQQDGEAFLIYGGNQPSLNNSLVFQGNGEPWDNFGRIVASLGDINGDEIQDFAIVGYSLRVISGSTLTVLNELNTDISTHCSINAVSQCEDINNDGLDELLVTITGPDSTDQYSYSILSLFLGDSELDTIPDFEISGEPSSQWTFLDNLGDINADGNPDFICGNFQYNPNGQPYANGYARIYSYGDFVGIHGDTHSSMPEKLKLFPAYPNPFNPTTTIRFTIPQNGLVTVTIYDQIGRITKTLLKRNQVAGEYSMEWNGTDEAGNQLGSGLYFCRINLNGIIRANKLILMK